MPKFIFSKMFLEIYYDYFQEYYPFDKDMQCDKKVIEEKLGNIEPILQDFIFSILGFRFSGVYNLTEVRMFFDNICKNLKMESKKSVADQIIDYKNEYLKMLEDHPYTDMFLTVLKRIFGKYYDGKLGNYTNFPNGFENTEAVIAHQDKSLVITKAPRPNTLSLPSIFINNIDRVEKSLERFIETVKESQTFYNIFINPGYNVYSDEEKIKMVFEAVLLNATTFDLSNIDLFFDRYSSFVKDEVFSNIQGLQYMGNAFEDDMYCMVKRSDVEFESPYYLSFMLANKRYELPNVRLSYCAKDNKAYIMAVQSSQMTPENMEIAEEVKRNIPRTPHFNFYNPMHFTSLIIAFGFLNGRGIQNVNIVDYMPIRYYKTIKDKKMDDAEADRYLTRLTNQQINTYMKIHDLTEGIELINYPGTGYNMSIYLHDEIICHNEYMQKLYNMGYELGKKYCLNDIPKKKYRTIM